MPRPFSTRRFTLFYAVATALLIALIGNLFHYAYHQAEKRLIEVRLGAFRRLAVAARQEMPEDRFLSWLENADLQPWAAPGWNGMVLAPDLSIRWSIRPTTTDALAPEVLAAIRDIRSATAPAVRILQISENRRTHVVHLQRIPPDSPEASVFLLRAPLPRFILDAHNLWLASALLAALLIGSFVFYQHLLLQHIRQLASTAGLSGILPLPAAREPFEIWARQYLDLASRKIAEERDYFDALFDLLQDGTLVIDSDNRIVRANTTAAALLGESSKALVGRLLAELPDHAPLDALVNEIRATATYQASEIQLHALSSLCSAAGIPLPDADRANSSHVMLVLRDLTRLRQLERAGEDYATNVSHELKTPLTLILGYTETLLAQGATDPEFRDRSLRTIERHAKRIIRIIDDLLRLAWLKNEAYTVGIPRTTVSVATLIDEAVTVSREWTRTAGIAIETHVPEGLVWHLNSGLIEEAIVNLVKNAILYALVGPVEVRARLLDNGNLELAVIDRGPGLKPEDAQRIFDRFYRADKSRARASGGSGLGLPIVQQIVEAHHGTARVETAPGEGCTFILEIPPGT